MKQTFYILTLSLGLLSCNGTSEKTVNNSVNEQPRQFKLTEIDAPLNPGDYYLSANINYFFSGDGDENSMDETPYLTEPSKLILDSIVDFLNQNGLARFRVYFFDEMGGEFDSCVPCSFEIEIKRYLVWKGINEDRILLSYNAVSTKDQEDNLNKIKNTPIVNSLNEFVLLVNEPIQ